MCNPPASALALVALVPDTKHLSHVLAQQRVVRGNKSSLLALLYVLPPVRLIQSVLQPER